LGQLQCSELDETRRRSKNYYINSTKCKCKCYWRRRCRHRGKSKSKGEKRGSS